MVEDASSPMESALRADGVRVTRQRVAILKALEQSMDHPDANELHRRAQEIDKSVSLATVYRTLSVLEDQGVIHRHAFEGGGARFETADMPHHDHIIDVESGEVLEFQNPRIEELQSEISAELGYEVVRHKLELYCRKKR